MLLNIFNKKSILMKIEYNKKIKKENGKMDDQKTLWSEKWNKKSI